MRTDFTPQQLADADVAVSEATLRKCVHCGFCTATCPTYVLLGDELDSPRGRIYQIQDMLERGGPPTPETVKHVDRCLSCLSCVSTCPSGVDYMHLVDHARVHIARTYRRPLPERMLRGLLSAVLTRRWLFRLALASARAVRFAAPLAPGRLKALLRLAPAARTPAASQAPQRASNPSARRVALLDGCVQPVLAPQINAAARRLLERQGVEVVTIRKDGCCGALPHHLGDQDRSHALAKARIAAWTAEIEEGGLEAIVITASGCGTTVKDYGFMFRNDPAWAEQAARVSALAVDITEFLERLDLKAAAPMGLTVAYHAACSLQHGQQVRTAPKALLARAGFRVVEPREAHLCCGSAGTYNILQPAIADQLGERKAANIDATASDLVAAGNIGCLTHLQGRLKIPVVHTVELLDWATGGPRPHFAAALDEASRTGPASMALG